MRRIGTLTNPDQAKRFADYLYTLSIECVVDVQKVGDDDSSGGTNEGADGGSNCECQLWIRDEKYVEVARTELEAFRKTPDDSKYAVGGQADKIRKDQEAEEKRRLRLQQRVQHRAPAAGGGAMMGAPVRQQSIPVVVTFVIISVLASFTTGFGRPEPSKIPGELSTGETVFFGMSFVDYRDYIVDGDPFASIKKGQVWRLVTPLFLHGDTYHLAFNMLGLFFLGSAIERLEGSVFLGILILACGIFGGLVQVWLPPAEELPALLSGLSGSPFSIGASGAVYGLFGYLWVRPALSPSYPVRMVASNVAIMLGWLVFCIFFVDRIANGAHIGGLMAGVVIAAVVSRIPGRQFN